MKDMNTNPEVSHVSRRVLAGVLGVALSGCGVDPGGDQEPIVRSFPSHYVAGGKHFSDLDALDAWVTSTGARALRLESCMSQPVEPLLAAVARFQHRYLQLHMVAAGEDGCPAATAEQGRAKKIAAMTGDTNGAVDQYWQRVMP